jgi:hypothetical protein
MNGGRRYTITAKPPAAYQLASKPYLAYAATATAKMKAALSIILLQRIGMLPPLFLLAVASDKADPAPPPPQSLPPRRPDAAEKSRSTFVADDLITRGPVTQQRPDRLSGKPQIMLQAFLIAHGAIRSSHFKAIGQRMHVAGSHEQRRQHGGWLFHGRVLPWYCGAGATALPLTGGLLKPGVRAVVGVSPLPHCRGNINLPNSRLIRTHLQSRMLGGAVAVAIAQGEAAMTLHAPALWVFILSLVLVALAVVGVFVEIPFVSMYTFWVAVLAYVVLALGNSLTY